MLSTKSDFEEMYGERFLQTGVDGWNMQRRGTQVLRLKNYISLVVPMLSNNGFMLDVGCGAGAFVSSLKNHKPEWNYSAFDISENVIEYNKKRYAEIDFQVGELPSIPFDDSKFDLVTAFEVIYYLDKEARRAALENVYKQLQSDGTLVLSTALSDGYIDPDALTGEISGLFKLESVHYLYLKLHNQLETRLFRLIRSFERLNKKLYRFSVCGLVPRWFVSLCVVTMRLAIRSVILARVSQVVGRLVFRLGSRSQAILVCRRL